MASFTCSDCMLTPPVNDSGGTGYATILEEGMEHKICYACMARRDRDFMDEHGKIALYYDGHKVTNWPGTLHFQLLSIHHGRHNIAGSRVDLWFKDHNRRIWHGVQYGNNTQVIHCRRLKSA
jgi:hypothetical protein